MRSLTSVAAGVAMLAAASFGAAPRAAADDDIQMPISDAFNYSLTEELAEAADTGVAGVSYMASCGCEPSCEAPCDCGDAGCGDDVGCGDCCGAKAAKKNPCAGSHKGLFYANDFSYLNDPCYNGCCLGDCLKQMDVCGCGPGGKGKLDIGGQLRLRFHSEQGMGHPGQLGFQDTDEEFLLSRLRLYTNYKINDWARFYAEGIFADAASNDQYVPRPIDRNYGDFLNLFFDVKLTDSTTVRVGRQELLYSSQRHISPLDWANTRRTFEGIRVLYKKGDWAVDGFYTNFVPVVANDFDEADYDRSFYGLYSTYTGAKNTTYDLFYIGFDDERALGSAAAGSRDFSVHTFGTRAFGGAGQWVWDLEAAYQTGRQSGLGLDHRAGMCTLGIGRKLDCKWSPTVWFYYDYASGNDGDGGAFNRYNQLFPLAHKYLGFADFIALSNVSSPNMLVTMKPSSKWNLLFWYYYLGAAVDTDIIPGVASNTAPIQNTTSDDWGHELDIIAKRTLGPRSNILFGYSNVWAGDKIINPLSDAQFYYTQWELNF
ncbi:MAG: alginate export family protein [Planctomycetota bacterium]